jgi:hypothetical protein
MTIHASTPEYIAEMATLADPIAEVAMLNIAWEAKQALLHANSEPEDVDGCVNEYHN